MTIKDSNVNANASAIDCFDPFSPEYLGDPYPCFADLRAVPAFYSAQIEHWVITRYRDIRQVFASPASFSASNSLAPFYALCPHAVRVLKEGGYAAVPALTNADGRVHAGHRRLANIAFTAKRVAGLEPFVREITQRLCEEYLCDGRADLMRDLAWTLPVLVLFKILDLPDSDLVRVKRGARSRGLVIFGRASKDDQIEAARELAAFWRYAAGLVEARSESPGDDFVSDLVRASVSESEGLTRQEATSIMLSMLFAGHETTTNLLVNSFRRLLEDRPSWEMICSEPSLIANAVEEVLRFDSSVIAWRHLTTKPADIGGVRVPAQAPLLLLLGSANRDEAVFADPNRFDIRRHNARDHLSFGYGAHTCLGAPLARLEARVVLEEVSRRFPTLRLASDVDYEFPPSISMRAPIALPVEW
jgi:cytochrome P450